MLRRVANDKVLLRTLRSTTSTINLPVRRCTRSITIIDAVAVRKLQTLSECRYSTENVKVDELIVDYNHVKNSTSNKKIFIVDVREPEEVREHGKIPNSINIPLGNVATALGTMSDSEFQTLYQRAKPTEESEIIFYCMIGKRSGMAQQNALNLGYKNVKNYLGSWTDWANKKQ